MLSLSVSFGLLPLVVFHSFAGSDGQPETVPVTRGPFAIVHEFKGSFDDPEACEIAYRGEKYKGALEIVEVAESGDVKEGQSLVRFDTTAIDQQLQDAALDVDITQWNLQRMQEEAKHSREAQAIRLASAEMSYKRAKQSLESYRDVLMPIRVAEAALSLQSSLDRFKESEEQYEQLLKMYKSDDLVEETEEIVLRREKRSLEQSRERIKFTRKRHELQTTVDIPRELRGHEFELRKATNAFELAKANASLRNEQSAAEMQKAKLSLERKMEELAQLRADKEALSVKAPKGGLAVMGQLVRGKWSRLDETARTLRVGKKASPQQVLFTIVQRGPKNVRTSVAESVVLEVAEGQQAVVVPAALADVELKAVVDRVARVSADGKYETHFTLSESDNRLLAGHSCTIRLTTSTLKDALTVPDGAVSKKDGKSVVHVWEQGQAQVREVQTGASSEGRTVIESGLREGERVLATPPKAETKKESAAK